MGSNKEQIAFQLAHCPGHVRFVTANKDCVLAASDAVRLGSKLIRHGVCAMGSYFLLFLFGVD